MNGGRLGFSEAFVGTTATGAAMVAMAIDFLEVFERAPLFFLCIL